jgi:hypothetical protein
MGKAIFGMSYEGRHVLLFRSFYTLEFLCSSWKMHTFFTVACKKCSGEKLLNVLYIFVFWYLFLLVVSWSVNSMLLFVVECLQKNNGHLKFILNLKKC